MWNVAGKSSSSRQRAIRPERPIDTTSRSGENPARTCRHAPQGVIGSSEDEGIIAFLHREVVQRLSATLTSPKCTNL